MERSQDKKPRAAVSRKSGARGSGKPAQSPKTPAVAKRPARKAAAAPVPKARGAARKPKPTPAPSKTRGKIAPGKAAKPVAGPRKAVGKDQAPTARKKKAARVSTSRPAPPRKVAPPRKTARVRPEATQPDLPPSVPLSEEEQIEAAKYLPREAPPRVFEEERFIFPQSYGVTRVRLLVKDPFWLFAHWDVAPAFWSGLKKQLGERTAALSRLTLKVTDADHGGGPVILLPEGARSWYIRADDVPRSYRAELGVTLPSGEFRRLAQSNQVTTPRVGPSHRKARRRQRWDATGRSQTAAALAESAPPAGQPGAWTPEGWTGSAAAPGGWSAPSAGEVSGLPELGGASDTFRR